MFAMSLAAYNAWGSVFTFVAVVMIIVAIVSLIAFIVGWVEMHDSYEEGNAYRTGRRVRLIGAIMTPLSLAIATAALLFAVQFNTEYNIRKDTTVPQRVDRSEVKIDSNAPTGVIVDGR